LGDAKIEKNEKQCRQTNLKKWSKILYKSSIEKNIVNCRNDKKREKPKKLIFLILIENII
jgi:hypothetical protein